MIGQPKPIKITKEEKLRFKIQKLRDDQKTRILKVREQKKSQVKKAKQKSIAQLKKLAQKAVNHYVLLRDTNLPCISCGATQGVWNAGHYIAQGSSGAIRFDPRNIHKQCVTCNLFKHGNLIEYRINLMERNPFAVQDMEGRRHEIRKWTREELEAIITTYTQLSKDLCM